MPDFLYSSEPGAELTFNSIVLSQELQLTVLLIVTNAGRFLQNLALIHFMTPKTCVERVIHRNIQWFLKMFVPDFYTGILFFFLIYLWLCWVFVSVRGFSLVAQVGATLHRGARASHYCSLSCCRAQAPDAQAQQLWLTGLVAPRHVGSSQTRG